MTIKYGNCVVPALEIKAWQTQVGDTANVVMRLKDDTKQEKDGSKDVVICMTAEKFRVLHHGNLMTRMMLPCK